MVLPALNWYCAASSTGPYAPMLCYWLCWRRQIFARAAACSTVCRVQYQYRYWWQRGARVVRGLLPVGQRTHSISTGHGLVVHGCALAWPGRNLAVLQQVIVPVLALLQRRSSPPAKLRQFNYWRLWQDGALTRAAAYREWTRSRRQGPGLLGGRNVGELAARADVLERERE